MTFCTCLRVVLLSLAIFTSSPFVARGQNANDRDAVAATRPQVSEEISPLKKVSVKSHDGQNVIAVVRKPPGEGPFPAVLMLHGGLRPVPLDVLEKQSRDSPTATRFLVAGYLTAIPTFRSRAKDPQSIDALMDCVAIIRHVRKMENVDSQSIVVYGCSGGGSLALRLAGEVDLSAVAAEEPASVLFTGMFNKSSPKKGTEYTPYDTVELFRDPKRFYTPEVRKITQQRVRKIRCPILFVRGDQLWAGVVDPAKINNEIVFPELKAASKQFDEIVYPGQRHCFAFRGTWSSKATWKFFTDCDSFFKRYLPTKPRPLNRSHIKNMRITSSEL